MSLVCPCTDPALNTPRRGEYHFAARLGDHRLFIYEHDRPLFNVAEIEFNSDGNVTMWQFQGDGLCPRGCFRMWRSVSPASRGLRVTTHPDVWSDAAAEAAPSCAMAQTAAPRIFSPAA